MRTLFRNSPSCLRLYNLNEPRCELGEGLLITDCGDRWWVDILQRTLIHWKDGDIQCFELPEMASKVLRVEGSSITLASESGVTRFNEYTQAFEVVHSAPPISWKGKWRSNDACYLPDGSILVGRMDFNPRPGTGDVVRYSKEGCEVVLKNIAIPNTFAYLSDRQSVLISDSLLKYIYECQVPTQPTAPLRKRLWKSFNGHIGTPDGAMLGSDGAVHIAMWGAACVARITVSGETLSETPIDALQPTSVAFDPVLGEVVITTATENMTRQQLVDYSRSGYLCTYSL